MPETVVNSVNEPSSNGARTRHVEIAYGVQLSLTTLPPAERRQIEGKITSLTTLRKLAKTADRGGEDGRLLIADVSADIRAAFRLTPTGAEVVTLISKRAFSQMFGDAKPVRRPKSKRPSGTRTNRKFPTP